MRGQAYDKGECWTVGLFSVKLPIYHWKIRPCEFLSCLKHMFSMFGIFWRLFHPKLPKKGWQMTLQLLGEGPSDQVAVGLRLGWHCDMTRWTWRYWDKPGLELKCLSNMDGFIYVCIYIHVFSYTRIKRFLIVTCKWMASLGRRYLFFDRSLIVFVSLLAGGRLIIYL